MGASAKPRAGLLGLCLVDGGPLGIFSGLHLMGVVFLASYQVSVSPEQSFIVFAFVVISPQHIAFSVEHL